MYSSRRRAEFAGPHAIHAAACRRHNAKLVGQSLVKLAVHPAQKFRRADIGLGRIFQPALHQHLHFDVRTAFELERAERRVRRVVVAQGLFDSERVGIVSLDQVRVIAVHRPQQLHHAAPGDGVERPAETGRFPQQIRSEFAQFAGFVRREKRLQSRWIVVKFAGLRHGSCPLQWPVSWPVSISVILTFSP